jgi:YHS domain-containing protein
LEITECKQKINNEKVVFRSKFNGKTFNPTSELRISDLLK